MKIITPEFLEAQFFMKGESAKSGDISPHQVHGSEIICVNDDNFSQFTRPEADGVMLTTTKASASIRVADCAPVMLWGKFWVMILHSGFKGTVLNISGRGCELVRSLFGDEAVRNACAWIGPCIGREIYCRDSFDEWTQKGITNFHRDNFDDKGEKIFFDLAGEIHSQLIEAGLDEANITLTGINTFTDSNCCSYRRGDKTERMTLYVRLKEGA